MEILLLEKVEKVGERGDIVKVKDGFARNYLIKRRLAVPATEGNIRHFKEIEKQKEQAKSRLLKKAKEIKEKIDNENFKIKLKIGKEGKAFGAITAPMIAETIKEKKGVGIDHRHIELQEPIRKKGKYEVTINLHPEVKASINLWVVEEK